MHTPFPRPMAQISEQAHQTARLEVLPGHDVVGRGQLLLRRAYRVALDGRLLPLPAEPLDGDPRVAEGPSLPLGSNFWPHKERTDLVVRGSAFAPGGAPTTRMTASVEVGTLRREVAVFGRREVHWTASGRIDFGDAEPFLEVPMTWQQAYGGVDFRVWDPELDLDAELGLPLVDHPGLYPRNPFGKGYLVRPEPAPGFELPQLEDPADLLTPERLVTQDPARWWQMPLPACFDWLPALCFPRCLFFADDCEPWFPGPDDRRLPEVARGYVPEGHQALMQGRPLEAGPHALFFQEAAPGLSLAGLKGGEPVRIRGMHPERPELAFALPSFPTVEFTEAGCSQARPVRLHSVICHPAEERVSLVFAADLALRHRYLPGIHHKIPLEVRIDRGPPIGCSTEAPEPISSITSESSQGGL